MPDFIEIDGRVHHYRLRRGDGDRTIVFSNSLGTDFRIWDGVIAALPSDYTCLTYDKAGHGLSQAGPTSIEGFGADLIALMEALEIGHATVCGVSVGGMIAQSVAATRPDLVEHLILCNTSFRIGDEDLWNTRIAAVERDGLPAIADGVIERWFSETFRSTQVAPTAGFATMVARASAEGYRTVCAAIRDADLYEGTKTLNCPTLCVAGSEDLSTPPAVVQALADAIAGADYLCFDNVGHLPCIEVPNALAAAIQTLIGGHTS